MEDSQGPSHRTTEKAEMHSGESLPPDGVWKRTPKVKSFNQAGFPEGLWLQAKNSEGSWEPLGGVDIPQCSFQVGGTSGI